MILNELVLEKYDTLIMRMGGELSVITNNSTEAESKEAMYWNPIINEWILKIEELKKEYRKQITRSD